MKKFQYIDEKIKLIIEEDIVGFYLIFYPNPNTDKSEKDFLLDNLEDAFDCAKKRYGISKQEWKEA